MNKHQGIKVSVIMPARNVELYIDEAIQSVIRQTGAIFELLIADDASTDKTWERIQTYKHDSRVRAWRSRKHRGAGATRNYLIARAKGIYLSFCDADDKMLAGHLRVMVQTLEKRPSVGVVYADRLIKDLSGRLRRLPRSRGPSETWDLIEGPISNGGTLMRRTLIKKVGGYRMDLPFLEDYDLFWKLAEVTRFLYLKTKPLYYYRERPGSLSNRFKKKYSKLRQSLLKQVILRRYGIRTSW